MDESLFRDLGKSMRLNAALKYKQANHKAVLGDIVLRITNAMSKPDFTSGIVTITIENPVEKRELEHAIKSTGHNIEYGINRELLKISPLSLFELVLGNLENPQREFTLIIQTHISDQDKKDNILNNTLTFRQKINKVGEELTEKSGLISILQAAGTALLV